MLRRIVGRLSYANVMATVAVFIAIGSGAYAAGLARDSVRSKQIKAGTVRNAELANDAVTSPKVADGSLRGADFAAGQLPQGPQGEPGPPGVEGPEGPAGSARAFGRVSGAGVSTRAFNASVTKTGTGRYCINPGAGINPATAVLILTVDDTDSDTGAKAYWDSTDPGCPGGFNVLTLDASDNQAPEAFSFMVP